MKKILSLILTAALGMFMFAGCGDDRPEATTAPPTEAPTVAPAVEPAPDPVSPPADENPAASGVIKTGLGIVTSASGSAPGSRVQVDSTMAAVTIDANGIITKLSLDSAQTQVAIDAAGQVTGEVSAPFPSKKEKLDAYGLKNISDIGKEWYEQAQAFEEWAIGKTVDEVTGMATTARDASHPSVPDVPDLAASVTINVGEFIEAVKKAAVNAKEATVTGDYQTGLGIITTATGRSAIADAAGQVQVTSDTVVFTVSGGVIVTSTVDSAYTTVQFNNTGAFTTDVSALAPSKLEMKDGYGMRARSGLGKEWFEQSEGLSEWTAGKTLDQVTGMAVDGGYPTDADVTASVSINVSGLLGTFAAAGNNLK